LSSPHVLVISPAFPKKEADTSTITYFLNYIEAYKESHPDVAFTFLALQFPFEASEYQWKGHEVYAFGGYEKSRIQKGLNFLKAFSKAIAVNKSKPFTAIHALWFRECALLAYYLSYVFGIKPISTLMGMELVKDNMYLRLANPSRFKMTAVSNRMKDQLIKKYANIDCEVIPYGCAENESKQDRTIDILFVGYINQIKNFQLFLDVCKQLLHENPDLKIEVIGDILNNTYTDQCREMELEGHINFTGMLPNEAVIAKMQQAKVLLHTASYEALGYVMLEALSCGMYVVSKDVGIAEPSEKWRIAESQDSFVAAVNDCMSSKTGFEPFVPHPIDNTVASYDELYKSEG